MLSKIFARMNTTRRRIRNQYSYMTNPVCDATIRHRAEVNYLYLRGYAAGLECAAGIVATNREVEKHFAPNELQNRMAHYIEPVTK